MRLLVFLNGVVQQNVAEVDTRNGVLKRYVDGKIVTERGDIHVVVKRVTSDLIEGDTKIVEETI